MSCVVKAVYSSTVVIAVAALPPPVPSTRKYCDGGYISSSRF
jgi:hypothetical protein